MFCARCALVHTRRPRADSAAAAQHHRGCDEARTAERSAWRIETAGRTPRRAQTPRAPRAGVDCVEVSKHSIFCRCFLNLCDAGSYEFERRGLFLAKKQRNFRRAPCENEVRLIDRVFSDRRIVLLSSGSLHPQELNTLKLALELRSKTR